MNDDTLVSPHRVDPNLARQVAENMIAARSTPRDPMVQAAYRQLEQQPDHAFMVLTRTTPGGAVRVVFTRCRGPPEDPVGRASPLRPVKPLVDHDGPPRLHTLEQRRRI